MGHLLNPVFRSIAPQNNNPKNLPVHGLNVIAFARIQTSSNGGFAPRRKCSGLHLKSVRTAFSTISGQN